MDRIFLFQNKFKDEDKIDDRLLYNVIDTYANRSLDTLKVVDADEIVCSKHVNKEWNREKIIPVGDIDFVSKWLLKNAGVDKMKPIEIPETLRRFTGREYSIIKGMDIDNQKYTSDKFFFKDADNIKNWNSLLYRGWDIANKIDSETHYVVSEYIDIVSEYRVFVHRDEVQACQHYLGNPLIFPDGDMISKMVEEYTAEDRPKGYTLDVAVMQTVINNKVMYNTVPLEVHAFAACGLYGFSEPIILPMLEQGYLWYAQGNQKY